MSIEIGQKYRIKNRPNDRDKLRVVDVNGEIAELERCEHHAGLAHETFPMRIDYLLERYDLLDGANDD